MPAQQRILKLCCMLAMKTQLHIARGVSVIGAN
jgi:hypothetical protein